MGPTCHSLLSPSCAQQSSVWGEESSRSSSTPCAGRRRTLPRRPAASDVAKSYTPSSLPSSSLALTLFFLCSPRLSSSSSLFRPQIASFLLRASNPPQPWVNHLASYPYNSSNPSLDTHFAGNRRFPGRRSSVTPKIHLHVAGSPQPPSARASYKNRSSTAP